MRKEIDLKTKYVKRLSNAWKDGFRCCLIDKDDESDVQKLFFEDDLKYWRK